MHDKLPYSALLSRLKEEAKGLRRATGKLHKVVLEELARRSGFPNYDVLQKLAEVEQRSRRVPVLLGGAIADIPPDAPTLVGAAVCRTPDEFRVHRSRLGDPIFAIKIDDDAVTDRWLFANDLQDAVAIGLRWQERGCAIEQYPVEQDDEIVFGYRVRNCTDRNLGELLYEGWLWRIVDADLNAEATPEIMTRLRRALFTFLSEGGNSTFLLLDFSRPKGESEFLQDWADEIEADRLDALS